MHPPHSIATFTGKIVEPFNLKDEDIDIYDIAKSLSNQCRFLGQVEKFYSVAQHCVLGVEALRKLHWSVPIQLCFLLHDAPEAYLCDIPSPLKSHPTFFNYRIIEDITLDIVLDHFGLRRCNQVNHELIKKMDRIMLMTEKRDLYPQKIHIYPSDLGIIPIKYKIVPWSPKKAYHAYIDTARWLIRSCYGPKGEEMYL